MTKAALKDYLDFQVDQYNKSEFIDNDPISIPHRFSRLQDIEIIGFWVAMLAWGQRKTIINKANELISLMDNAPYDFVVNHEEKDRKKLLSFKHRTFQATDTLYFLEFLQWFYRQNDSLEMAFLSEDNENCPSVEAALIHFHELFFRFPMLQNALESTLPHLLENLRASV